MCDEQYHAHMATTPEVVLVVDEGVRFHWQTRLPVDEMVRRLRAAADVLEEQIVEGRFDDQLALVGR